MIATTQPTETSPEPKTVDTEGKAKTGYPATLWGVLHHLIHAGFWLAVVFILFWPH